MTENVTNRQMFFIIFLRIVAGSVLSLPLIMAQKAETGAWLVLLIASIIACIPVVIIVYLGNLFKGKTLFEYSKLLVGKFLTYIFALIYILYHFSLVVLLTRSTADVIKGEFLNKTPLYSTMILLLIVTGYAASKKLNNLGRICEFLGIIILIANFVLHTVMLTQGDFRNIKPFFDISQINSYLKAFPSTIFLFIGFESLTIIPFTKANGKKSIWISIISILTAGITYIYVTQTCYMILGVEDVAHYNYPNVAAIRILDIPVLQFLKRLDLIFINAWVFSIFCSLSFVIFTVTQYTQKLFSKLNFNFILMIVCVLAFIAGLLPKGPKQVSDIHLFLTTYFGFIPALLIPLILLIVAKIRGKSLNINRVR